MKRSYAFWICLLIFAVAPTAAFAQSSDTTPPTLVNLSFSPATIDVRTGSKSVTVTADITDDLSGFRHLTVSFRSPSGNQERYRYIYASDNPSQNPLNGRFEGALDFPMGSEAGTWRVYSLYIYDQVFNTIAWDTSQLEAAGFQTSLEVVSIPDTTPPVLTSLSISPDPIDVSSGDRNVTIRFGVSDDKSGLDTEPPPPTPNSRWHHLLSAYSPSFTQFHYVVYYSLLPVSGTPLDGVYETTIQIPQYSEQGQWTISISLFDVAGNVVGYYPWGNWPTGSPPTFTVNSSPSDTTAPKLKNLSFSPTFIDTSQGPQTVNVTMELTDDLSGLLDEFYVAPYSFYWGGAYFVSPSGAQYRLAPLLSDGQIISGDRFSGVWQAEAWFPQFSEAGTWKVGTPFPSGAVSFLDRVRNRTDLSTEDLESMGFPTQLVVVKPSLAVDGTIDAKGGTVQDQVFGARAQISLPVNAVGESTDVAIDVFPDPLGVPLPAGFEAAETYFANIHLTPEPSYPLNAPGMTIVLPLWTWRIPSTSLHLYRIDPVSGNLVPAIGTDGNPVVGTVGPDGMSATFTGVARLSVVAGLVPNTLPVAVDIKPGSDLNIVSLKAKGKLPIAILGSQTFDVRTVNVTKLFFGPASARPAQDLTNPSTYADHLQDVNGDGFVDLVLHFDLKSAGLTGADTQACLSGETLDAIPIKGCDSIRVIK